MHPNTKNQLLYKDYNKSVTDLLTKSYNGATKWKLESKLKPQADRFVVNPSATSDGVFKTDVEYLVSQCGANLKATFVPSTSELRGVVSYSHLGHKVEGTLGSDRAYEVSHEGTFQGCIAVHEKFLKNTLEVGVSAAVLPNLHAGVGTLYHFKDKHCRWTASCRYAKAGFTGAVSTNALKTYVTSFLVRVPSCPHRVLVAGEVTCGRGHAWSGTVGVEVDCLLVKGNTLKARVNRDLVWAVAYVAKVAGNWTIAVTIDKTLRPGVLLTHS